MRLFIAIIILFLPFHANASSEYELSKFANNLAVVISSEKVCNLTYNQSAIEQLIEESVPADNLGFPNSLAINIRISTRQVNQIDGSAKTAHCASISRVAKAYGFIE